MCNQEILDWGWRHVLALGGFEDFLDSASDFETAHFIDLTCVACPDPSVFGYRLLVGFVILEVPHHPAWSLDLNFTIMCNPMLHTLKAIFRHSERLSLAGLIQTRRSRMSPSCHTPPTLEGPDGRTIQVSFRVWGQSTDPAKRTQSKPKPRRIFLLTKKLMIGMLNKLGVS
jgi:hypothetical protein